MIDENDPFIKHLRKTREIVSKWPAWKQNVLSRVNLPEKKSAMTLTKLIDKLESLRKEHPDATVRISVTSPGYDDNITLIEPLEGVDYDDFNSITICGEAGQGDAFRN